MVRGRASAALAAPAKTVPQIQGGAHAGALDAVRDVIGWNTVWDPINRRPYTSLSRNWVSQKFGGFGVWLDDPAYPIDGEVRTVLEAAIAKLRQAGCAVSDRRPAVDLPGAVRTYFQLLFPVVLADLPRQIFTDMAAAAAMSVNI